MTEEEFKEELNKFDPDSIMEQLKVDLLQEHALQEEAARKEYGEKVQECKTLKEQYDAHPEPASDEAKDIFEKLVRGFQDMAKMAKKYQEKYDVLITEP